MTLEQIEKVFKEIQNGVPEILRKTVVIEVEKTPAMKFLAEKMLEEGVGTPEEREQVKNLLEAGEFSKMKYVENAKVAKMIDNYINREIKKAIKQGRLPKNAEDIPGFKELYEKVYTGQN